MSAAKAGESDLALIDVDRLEPEGIHPLLIADVRRGLADIEAGRTVGADAALAERQARLQQRRAATSTGRAAKKRG